MFRRFAFVLLAVLVAALPAAAQSQSVSVNAQSNSDIKPVQLTIGGGFTGVYGAGSDRLGNGGNFTLGVLFNVNPVVGLQGEYTWNGVKQKQLSLPVFAQPIASTGVPTDFFADTNMQYFDFNLHLNGATGGKAQPYVVTGLGVYYRPITISTPAVGYTTICDPYWYVCYPAAVPVEQVVGSRSSTDFGMNLGGGMNFKVHNNTSIFFEIRYHYVWGPSLANADVPTQPIAGVPPPTLSTLKANGQFLPITVGFRF